MSTYPLFFADEFGDAGFNIKVVRVHQWMLLMERRRRRRCLGQSLGRQRGGRRGDRTVRRWRRRLTTNQRQWAVVMIQAGLLVMLMMHSRSRSGCRTGGGDGASWAFATRDSTSFDSRRARRRSRRWRRCGRRCRLFFHDMRPGLLDLVWWPCGTFNQSPGRRRRADYRWMNSRHQRTGIAAVIGSRRVGVSIAVEFGKTADFQRLGDAQQRRQFLLGDGNLAAVHVLDDGLELRPARVLQNDDRMLARIVEKEMLEIGRTGRQDHTVGLDGVPVRGQSDVDERFVLQQLIKDARQVRLVVVPAEAQVRRARRRRWRWRRRRGHFRRHPWVKTKTNVENRWTRFADKMADQTINARQTQTYAAGPPKNEKNLFLSMTKDFQQGIPSRLYCLLPASSSHAQGYKLKRKKINKNSPVLFPQSTTKNFHLFKMGTRWEK